MPKVLVPDIFRQHFDDLGEELAGGKIHTYVSGTTTPKTTWTESTGATPHANPIILNAAGREDGGIWVTVGEAYKFVLMNALNVTLSTTDVVVIGEADAATDEEIDLTFPYIGTPGASGTMGLYPCTRSFTFPANFSGSRGMVETNPGSDFVIKVYRNGIEVGTITIASSGTFTFATTGGATVAFVAGDELRLNGPTAVGTAVDISVTLLADIV